MEGKGGGMLLGGNWSTYRRLWGVGMAHLVERRIRDQKVASSNLGRSSSPGLIFCTDILFGVRPTPVLPQWHVKDPSFSAKNAGGRLYPNTLTPSTKRGRGGLTMLLTYSVGILSWKRAHTQLVRKRSATVVSAR